MRPAVPSRFSEDLNDECMSFVLISRDMDQWKYRQSTDLACINDPSDSKRIRGRCVGSSRLLELCRKHIIYDVQWVSYFPAAGLGKLSLTRSVCAVEPRHILRQKLVHEYWWCSTTLFRVIVINLSHHLKGSARLIALAAAFGVLFGWSIHAYTIDSHHPQSCVCCILNWSRSLLLLSIRECPMGSGR